jgi:hypothetical protein
LGEMGKAIIDDLLFSFEPDDPLEPDAPAPQ